MIGPGGAESGTARSSWTSRRGARSTSFAATPPQRDYARRASRLDPFEPYLRRRWAEGCRNGLQLWREIRERGYADASRPVSRWAQDRRTAPAPSTPRRHLPADDGVASTRPVALRSAVPQLARLLVRDPGGLDDAELQLLDRLQAACPPAATAYPLLQALARIIREQDASQPDAWLAAASACGVPDVATFAAGLGRERPELLAALTLPWSTGPVEGQITRLKLVKRQGYGRCGLDMLKRRFLRAA